MTRGRFEFGRIHFFFLGFAGITIAIVLRLFYLQVIEHGYYKEIAEREQYGYTTLPARRGEILIQDYQSGESYALATNTTLNMIYADPALIDDPDTVADTLAPLLFDLEIEKEKDEKRHEEEFKAIEKLESEILKEEALSHLKLMSDEELLEKYTQNLKDIFEKKLRDTILIQENVDPATQEKIRQANLEGIEMTEKGNLYAYPSKIGNKEAVAKSLAEIFKTEVKDLETILKGKNHYVELKHRLTPEVSQQIEKIFEDDRDKTRIENKKRDKNDQKDPVYLGIRLKEEYFRFYPEQELAAQVLGYVDSSSTGSYGVEGTYDELLQGKDGIFASQMDANGNQITVGDSVIESAVDGADITLTIDRAIQLQVERYLEAGVKDSRAESGQAMVIDPRTGYILAMAQYPTFNPNIYGEVFEKEEIEIPEDQKAERLITKGSKENPEYWYYLQVNPDLKIQVFQDAENPDQFYAYKNAIGPGAYRNQSLQDTYEPGSVFKPLAMAAAVDAGEVTANSTFLDSGALDVDYNVYTKEYDNKIDTFNKQHHGVESMTQVLQNSCNIGMSYIARKLGPSLFYSYIKALGFTQRTDIGINDEVTGTVAHYSQWNAESELLTKAFGQGLSLTPLQLLQAYTALANEGTMMRPQLVRKIVHPDGQVEEFEPEVVRQVFKEETARTLTAMITSVMETYVSVKLPDHFTAGKTGTAQTYKGGRALGGPGTTMATVVGYGPIDTPQFLVLVKMEKPRRIEWAESTSGPVFHNITSFLYDYYNLPPDKDLKQSL
jgi:stage V sporulation protein D (sporulation-specific penicillin-binding protein)